MAGLKPCASTTNNGKDKNAGRMPTLQEHQGALAIEDRFLVSKSKSGRSVVILLETLVFWHRTESPIVMRAVHDQLYCKRDRSESGRDGCYYVFVVARKFVREVAHP